MTDDRYPLRPDPLVLPPRATIRFDGASPEAGWPPFMAWLTEHGLDPRDVCSVEVAEDPDDQDTAEVVEYARDDLGRKFLDAGTREPATVTRDVLITRLPPRRTNRSTL